MLSAIVSAYKTFTIESKKPSNTSSSQKLAGDSS